MPLPPPRPLRHPSHRPTTTSSSFRTGRPVEKVKENLGKRFHHFEPKEETQKERNWRRWQLHARRYSTYLFSFSLIRLYVKVSLPGEQLDYLDAMEASLEEHDYPLRQKLNRTGKRMMITLLPKIQQGKSNCASQKNTQMRFNSIMLYIYIYIYIVSTFVFAVGRIRYWYLRGRRRFLEFLISMLK